MSSLYMPQCLWHTGFSLIPIYGDKDTSRPKAAAVSWSSYQEQRATWLQVVQWVAVDGYQMAVVTGRVSGVVVVDFDDMALWQKFLASPLPALLGQCLTVRTRRGMHLYLPVPQRGAAIRSRSGLGWDLLATGCYAVAPHSIINGHGYGIGIGDPAQLGTPDDSKVAAVLAWLTEQAPLPGHDQDDAAAQSAAGIEEGERLLIEGARALYRTWSTKRGRNAALYLVARLMHDHFYDIDAAIEALADLHITARPPEGHTPETPEARRREALATIRSAYSKPRRAMRAVPIRQLPNGIREYLNQVGLTSAARLLDALRSKGIRPGSFLTRREIAAAVAGVVRGYSVRKGIEWLVSLPKTHPTTAISRSEGIDTNCFCIGGQKRLISNRYKKGKESALIYLPTDEALAAIAGITLTKASDPTSLQELKSARRYRAALYREFIRRRPGTYGRELLAAKHGVHHRTLRRYARAENICIAPTIITTPLTGTAVQGLGFGAAETVEVYYNKAGRNRTRAVYLVDEDDNRYPALSVVAAKLIAQGKKLTLCQRLSNYYWHASQTERAPAAPRAIAPEQKPLPEPVGKAAKKKTVSKSPIFSEEPLPGDGANEAAFLHLFDRVVQLKERKRKPPAWRRSLPAHSARRYRKPLPHAAHEYVATMIHKQWPDITMETARRVVHLRGGQQVYKAMSIMEKRHNVRNPSGFFLSVVGYQHAAQQQNDEKKQYRYRVIHPRRRARYARNGGA